MRCATVAESADAADLKSVDENRTSSSLVSSTTGCGQLVAHPAFVEVSKCYAWANTDDVVVHIGYSDLGWYEHLASQKSAMR